MRVKERLDMIMSLRLLIVLRTHEQVEVEVEVSADSCQN